MTDASMKERAVFVASGFVADIVAMPEMVSIQVIAQLLTAMPENKRREVVRSLAEMILRRVATGAKDDGLRFGEPHRA